MKSNVLAKASRCHWRFLYGYIGILKIVFKVLKDKWTIHNIPDVWVEKIQKTHPHSKPLELQKVLIKATTQKEDWALDPAAGGYSVLSACRELKRNFIGCDIEFGEEPQHTENAA